MSILAGDTRSGTIPGTVIAVSGTGGAGAQVQVTLPADPNKFTFISSFIVTSSAPGSMVSGIVTVTGVVGTTLNFYFVESTTAGGFLEVNFPWPWPSSAINTGIVVTLPAIGSGGSGAISAMGYQRYASIS